MSQATHKQILVIFRYDDYSNVSPTDTELRIFELFEEHKVPCTVGVIPCVVEGTAEDPAPANVVPLCDMKTAMLKRAIRAQLVEPALHGYSHQTHRARGQGGLSEFAGLDYRYQTRRIAKAKSVLEETLGIPITTFIPPWNSYDLSTVLALEKTGFRAISAGRTGPASKFSRLKYLPWTCGLLDLQSVVESARQSADSQPAIVVLFHPDDLAESGGDPARLTYADLAALLGWLVSQADVRMCTINRAIEGTGDFDAYRYLTYSYLASSIRRRIFKNQIHYYPSSDTLQRMRMKYHMFLTIVCLVNIVSALLAQRLVLRLYNHASERRAVCRVEVSR